MTHVEAGRAGGTVTALKLKALREERASVFNKKCLQCSGPIAYAKRRNDYCGHSCAAKLINVRRGAQLHEPKNCEVCGKAIDTSCKRCCSQKCQKEFTYRNWIERWLAGYEDGLGSRGKLSGFVRRYLVETRGDKCEKCGWAEIHPITGKIPVTVHHVDGKWQNTRPENLQILCPNCHSLTPTFQALNRGNGHPARRLSYKRAGEIQLTPN